MMFSKLALYFYVSYFLLQQGILSKLFDLVNCETYNFDDIEHKDFLKNYLGIECYTKNHYFWISIMLIPGFFIYAILLPLSTLIFSYIKKKEKTTKSNIIKFDFLMRQFFIKFPSFWGNIYFYRKLIFVIIVIFYDDQFVQSTLIVFILILWNSFLPKINHFVTKNLLEKEFIQNLILIFIILTSILAFKSENELVSSFLNVFIVILKIYFIGSNFFWFLVFKSKTRLIKILRK